METETLQNSYRVKAGTFEGPLGLLLSLIEARKLFINEISLAAVAEDYITHVRNLSAEEKNVHDITSFIVIAATLILIKSRSLLPNLDLAPEEEKSIDDLERRLRLYQKVQEISAGLKTRFGSQMIFVREESLDIGPVFTPGDQITLESMAQSVRDIIHAIPKKEILPEVSVKKVMSIEEMMNSLEERIKHAVSSMSFRNFSQTDSSATPKEQKVHTIISFLALLELVRSGIADVIQNDQFDDMMITKQEVHEGISEGDVVNEVV